MVIKDMADSEHKEQEEASFTSDLRHARREAVCDVETGVN